VPIEEVSIEYLTPSWPDDLCKRNSTRYSGDVPAYQKWSS